MSVDVGIALFDFSKFSKERVTSHFDLIKKDLKDEESSEYGGLIREVNSASEYIEKVCDFDEDSVNTLNIYDILLYLSGNPITLNEQFNSFSLGKNNILMSVRIPEFLAQHSKETAALWYKLVGSWEWNSESENSSDISRKLKIGETEYLLKCEQGGYLQGEEIKKLRNGLKSIIPEVDEFYDSLESDKRRRWAKKARPIELIYGLASSEYNIFEASTLIYYRDT